jgi:hypothetical protein
MDRGSFRALAVAAGDGAGSHMVKMAHVVVRSRRRGKVPESASRAVTPYRRSGVPPSRDLGTPAVRRTLAGIVRGHEAGTVTPPA